MAPRKPPSAVSLEDARPSVSVLVYGHPGVGKTVWGGGPGGADLIISTEKDEGISAKTQGGRGKIIVCRDFEQFLAAKEAWESGYYGNPEWTLFDSWGSIQEKMIKWILEREFGKDAKRKLDVMQIQDHLEYQNMTKRIIGELCDSPRNVVFTAHSMKVSSDEGEEQWLPMLQGKDGGIATICAGMVTVAGYLRVIQPPGEKDNLEADVTRRIYWQARPPYFAKDWTGRLPRYTDNASLSQIAARINGNDRSAMDSSPTSKPGVSKKNSASSAGMSVAERRAARSR